MLRGVLVAVLVASFAACGLVLIVTVDLSASYPRVAALQVPIAVAALLGLLPVLAGVAVPFRLVTLIDQGEAFSTATVRLLRALKRLAASVAVYGCIGFVALWTALQPDESPSLFLAWLGAETVAMFFYALLAVIERLFGEALELRQDSDVTV